ncbi:unnamed protein product [Macrosiphum euphorbiae]|uniref:Ubiquitin-like protease family profile domain-containing protein n=1 Tax=Macrosiphum euphorbiae TaxID=13131 RepID=A0AAV0XYT3_9HEMI|nr:unnamed protein product [Macrosiphum euphorbiae]
MQYPGYISIETIGMNYEKRRRIDRERDKLSAKNILEVKIDGRPFEIKIHDYRLLEKGMMMNDKLIEFYLVHMHSKLSDKDKDKSYVFSTLFYTSLTKPVYLCTNDPSLSRSKNRHNKVKRWTRILDVFKKDFIFVPIHKGGHWILAVICFPYLTGKVHIENGTPSNEPDDDTGRYKVSFPPVTCGLDEADPNVEDLWLFDLCSQASMKNHQDRYDKYYDDVEVLKTQKKNKLVKRPCILIFDSYARSTMSNAMVSATLREWLQHEYSNKYNGQQKDFQFMKACTVKVPQQPNQTDCGLFVMHFFEMFYSRPIIDYTFPIHHLENWFHTDEVVKNEKKRKEVYNIIMEERKAEPSSDGFELPVLHLNDHIEESVDIHNMNDLFEKNDKKNKEEKRRKKRRKKEEEKEEKEDKREEGKKKKKTF